MDLVYSVLNELFVVFVGLDPVKHGDAVSPAEDFLDVNYLRQGFSCGCDQACQDECGK